VLKDGSIKDLEVKRLTKTANSGIMIKNEGNIVRRMTRKN
jgi:hypothetical protein